MKLSNQQKNQIKELLQRGTPVKDIAEACKCAVQTVYAYRVKYKEDLSKSDLSKYTSRQLIEELRRRGYEGDLVCKIRVKV